MVQIQFPDGAVRSYEKGITALGIAKSISEGLAKKVLAASIDGEVWDATRPINQDAALKLLTWDDADGKNTFWHSSAHLLAEAVEMQFPGAKFWVGPALEKGFYYDIDLGGKTIKEEDVVVLEQKMNELAKKANIPPALFLPKIQSTVLERAHGALIKQESIISGLTGPLIRMDETTILANRKAIQSIPGMDELYCAMCKAGIELLVKEQILTSQQGNRLFEVLLEMPSDGQNAS